MSEIWVVETAKKSGGKTVTLFHSREDAVKSTGKSDVPSGDYVEVETSHEMITVFRSPEEDRTFFELHFKYERESHLS